MAKKHFDAYYEKVCEQYHVMLEELKDMQKEFEEGFVSPEMYEQMKQVIEPIKRNYQILSYVYFELNKPNRKSKQARYQQQNRKLLKDIITDKQVFEENDEALDKLKKLF